MKAKITDQQLKDELALNMSCSAIALKYDMNIRNVQTRKAKLVHRGWSPDHDMTKETPEGFSVKGTSTLYDGEGNITAQWVKTQQDKEQQLQLIKDTIHMWVDELPKAPKAPIPKHKYEDMLAVYPLGDPHIGMFSWAKETGESWDLKEAEKVFAGVFDRVIKSAPPCNEAVIVNLGDFFHYDNLAGVTTRSGHVLDTDGHYAKMIQIGIQIIRRMITTALSHHKKVRVINVIGNHDDVSSIFLGACLTHVYENEPRVVIDDSPTPFHYIKFGKVLLGAHHGHSCKADKLPGVMATDRAKEWGDTEHRYWLTGHIHHDSKKEYPGCTVESFRTLAAKDAYATWGGWRSGRDTKAIVYHKEHGEIERHTIHISQIKE